MSLPSVHNGHDGKGATVEANEKGVKDHDDGGGVDHNHSAFVLGGGAINEKVRRYGTGSGTGAAAASGAAREKAEEADSRLDHGRRNERDHGGDDAEDAPPSLSSPSRRSNRHFDPSNVVSHALHSLAGLDRYPNYLSRWSLDDVSTLERALESQLDDVRRQKRSIEERREGIAKLVQRAVGDGGTVEDDDVAARSSSSSSASAAAASTSLARLLTPPSTWDEMRSTVLDPRASDVVFRSKWFARGTKRGRRRGRGPSSSSSASDAEDSPTGPSVSDVLNGRVAVELDPALLEGWIDQEMFDVYSFPLLSRDFCARIKTFIRTLTELADNKEFAHLNIGRRPVDLDTIGLGWINDLLFNLFVRPISRHLFHETESLDELDWRQGYVAGYSSDPSAERAVVRHRLVPHTDDSEVTLNACLGDDDFVGGALRFYGLRGTDDEGKLLGEFQPRIGTALLHAGRNLHEVTEVGSGDRYALIVWARSWKGARAESCPCCWLNRRRGTDCICGLRWN